MNLPERNQHKIDELFDLFEKERKNIILSAIMDRNISLAFKKQKLEESKKIIETWIERVDKAIEDVKPQITKGIMTKAIKNSIFVNRKGNPVQCLSSQFISNNIFYVIVDLVENDNYIVNVDGVLCQKRDYENIIEFDKSENGRDIMQKYKYREVKERYRK